MADNQNSDALFLNDSTKAMILQLYSSLRGVWLSVQGAVATRSSRYLLVTTWSLPLAVL